MNKFKQKNNSGQTMLLVVLAVGGTILGATTIGGLLLNYQIRQSTEIVNSTKAIFAANAGFDLALKVFATTDNSIAFPATLNLANGASADIRCYESDFQTLISCAEDAATWIRSVGTFGKISRALELNLQ